MKRSTVSKKMELLLLLSASLLFVTGCLYIYQFFVDDTYISLRYAKNLVEYGKLSFNPGDAPVEGYTNLLLVLLEGFFIKMGVQGVTQIPKITGIMSGLGAIFLTYKISCRLMPEEALWARCLPVFATALNSSLIVWAVGGLETNLFLLLILGGVYFHISNIETGSIKTALLSDFVFFVALLCRPDALLIWGLGYLFLFLVYKQINLRSRLYGMIMSAVLIGGYFLWKYIYFGNLLPTTFYAKVEPVSFKTINEGLTLYRLFIEYGIHSIYFLLLGYAVWNLKRAVSGSLTYVFILFCGYSAYLIYLGNPALNHGYRFYVPIIPLFYILGAYGLSQLSRLTANRSVIAVVVIALYVAQFGAGSYWLYRFWNIDFGWKKGNENIGINEIVKLSENHARLGRWIGEKFGSDTTVVVGDIGAIGYFSGARIVDSWSILDKRIIELKREQAPFKNGEAEFMKREQQIASYIFDHRPDLIRLDYVNYSLDPRAQEYVLIDNPVDNQMYCFFIRQDLLSEVLPGSMRLGDFVRRYWR